MSGARITPEVQQAPLCGTDAASEGSPAPAAEAWFRQELATCRHRMGQAWPAHRQWVADYLRHEARERFPLQLEGHRPGATP